MEHEAGLGGALEDEGAHQLELALVVDQRDHHLEVGRHPRALAHGLGRGEDRIGLHPVDLGVEDPEAHPARAEHRVDLLERLDALPRALEHRQVIRALSARPLDVLLDLRLVRQELVQRRIEQADGHRKAGHRVEEPFEVGLLQRPQDLQAALATLAVLGQDHVGHQRLTLAEEHVLRPAQPDALRAEGPRLLGVLGRVGVGPHAHQPRGVGPLQHAQEVRGHLGLDDRHLLDGDRARGAVDGQVIALAQHGLPHPDLTRGHVDLQRRGACHGRSPHPAGDERRVGGLAALGGQDPLGGVEARHVLSLGERPHEDDLTPFRSGGAGVVGGEHDGALGGPRRGGDPLGEHHVVRRRVEGRVQQRVQALGVDGQQRRSGVQEPLGHRVDREAHRGLRRALGVPGLQQVQPSVLDGELRVLHVPVVLLQAPQDGHQLGVDLRQPALEL